MSFTVRKPAELLAFIEKSLYGISRSKAKAILAGQGVMVNKNIVTQYNYPLQAGMVVEISRRKPSGVVSSKYLRIVYEDHDVIVVDKREGILSAPAPRHSFSVKTILDDHLRLSHQKCTSHVIHRLDRDTSGLMVYAKNIETAENMEYHWKELVTDRRYVALVEGKMERQKGVIESWLTEGEGYKVESSAVDNGGKHAVTHFTTLSSGEKYSLVEMRLDTGRKNQIRVHMQQIGHPVCGDAKYGSRCNPAGRICLHAYKLSFTHPRTGQPMNFETPVPAEFLRAQGTGTMAAGDNEQKTSATNFSM